MKTKNLIKIPLEESKHFKIRRNNLLIIFTVLLFVMSACKKLVQESPSTSQISAVTVYGNNSTASAVMSGLYISMLQNPGPTDGQGSVGYEMALASDELKLFSSSEMPDIQFYTNALNSVDRSGGPTYWSDYGPIYICNDVIAGVSSSAKITPAIKNQLTGEAKFMRAFFYFYLTNLYGDVPLALTTDYQTNNTISRSPQTAVYQQVIADLQSAESLLPGDFKDPYGTTTTERTRPNKGAATALLARVYLYYGNLTNAMANYTKAVTQSDSVINNSQYSLLTDLDNVFLANSNETIWQLQPNLPGFNTFDAYYYVLTTPPGTGHNFVSMSSELIGAFEPNDQRFTNWVGIYTDPNTNTNYYYPFKYKVYTPNQPLTEYKMVLRLAEQYLIRAEAEARLGNIGAARADLNVIRNRAGLPNTTATTQASLLTAILHERQVEMFSEWGHRWFDLKRTNKLDSVMSVVTPQKGGTWKSTDALLPLPLSELQANHNLVQNPGY